MPRPLPRKRVAVKPKRVAVRPAVAAASRPSPPPKPGLPRAQALVFREILLRKRHELVDDVEQLEGEATRRTRQDDAGDLSTMPIHLADLGTDNFEKDMNFELIETDEEEVREIDAALVRIKKGIFGRCEKCAKMISQQRLKALPYARLCISCKSEEEGAE